MAIPNIEEAHPTEVGQDPNVRLSQFGTHLSSGPSSGHGTHLSWMVSSTPQDPVFRWLAKVLRGRWAGEAGRRWVVWGCLGCGPIRLGVFSLFFSSCFSLVSEMRFFHDIG